MTLLSALPCDSRRKRPNCRDVKSTDKAVVSALAPALEYRFMTPVNHSAVKKPEPGQKPDFESSLGRLEEIVGKLEGASLSLDEAMKLFEEGVQLSRDCQKHLEQAEGKVEILLKKAGGELAAEAFDPEGEEES
jgi:exodeoxyribonuclease VII small subunit